MSIPSLFALVGFFLGIILHGVLLVTVVRRPRRTALERGLIVLLAGLLIWYGGNFLSAILGRMIYANTARALMVTDAVAFSALSFLPALLLHTHWLYYRRFFEPTSLEQRSVRVLLVLLYATTLLLPLALGELLSGESGHSLEKLGPFRTPFLILLAISYIGSAWLQRQIVRRSTKPIEAGLFRGLFLLFLVIPVFTLWVFEFANPAAGFYPYVETLALLASAFPAFLVAYYIYRYQFLQIRVHRGLVSAVMVLLFMVVYLAGVRTLVQFLHEALGAPAFLLEATFLFSLLLIFPPISRWLQHWVSRSFSEDIDHFRQVAERIQSGSPGIVSTRDLAEEIAQLLQQEYPESEAEIHLGRFQPRGEGVYALAAGDEPVGFLEFRSFEDSSPGQREGLRVLLAEIGSALERSRLLERQVALEREVARKSHLEELGRMAATIAHNVKNPLSSIKTLLQLQRESKNLTPDQQREFGMMLEEVNRLSKTVTSLLRFSKLESGEAHELTDIAPRVLVEAVTAVFQGSLTERRLKLDIDLRNDLPPVRANTDGLRDVLANLLANAVEASPPGGTIGIRAEREGDRIDLLIEDEGPGIPEGILNRLFQPFVTTKSSGTGLGLAIARRRMEQMYGDLRIVARNPSGTRAIVGLQISSRTEDHGRAKENP